MSDGAERRSPTAVTVIRLPKLAEPEARRILLLEAVADAAHGEEELGLLRVALELLPQVADVDVDGARVAVLGVAPDVLEQGLAGEHPAGRAGERAEDLELDVGDADLLARAG